jgi:YidC/Oxa1 family membrane protein insertase
MDNNRTLLAIALIILVWSGYGMLFPPQPPQAEVATQVASEQYVDNETAKVTEVKSVTEATEQQQPVVVPTEEKRVRVESDLYVFELSSIGAKMRQATLKKYKEVNEPDAASVNLVKGEAEHLATFKTSGKEGLSLPANTPYALQDNKTNYFLSGEDNQSVTFVANTSTGLEVHKTYTFYADSYRVDLKISVALQPPNPNELVKTVSRGVSRGS